MRLLRLTVEPLICVSRSFEREGRHRVRDGARDCDRELRAGPTGLNVNIVHRWCDVKVS